MRSEQKAEIAEYSSEKRTSFQKLKQIDAIQPSLIQSLSKDPYVQYPYLPSPAPPYLN